MIPVVRGGRFFTQLGYDLKNSIQERSGGIVQCMCMTDERGSRAL